MTTRPFSNYYRSLACLIGLLGLFTNTWGQNVDDLAKLLSEELDSLATKMAASHLYVQTSKGIYERGEDLWFKAYELDAQYLEPFTESNTLFVQMIHEKEGTVAWQERYEMNNGFAEGHIYLYDTLTTGDYQLVVCTVNSLPPDDLTFYALRKIQIVEDIQSFRKNPDRSAVNNQLSEFTLFPEGGHLVNGLTGQVAFKAVNSLGQPVAVKGMLFQGGQQLRAIESTHAGMGKFELTPDKDQEYHIALESPRQDSVYQLPPIQSQGISMNRTEQYEDKVVFTISKTEDFINEPLYFRIQLRGITYGLAKIGPGRKSRLVLPLKDYPQGIAECTIFNNRYQALTERLIYINSEKKLHITTYLDSSEQLNQFSTREKIPIKIHIKDDQGQPVLGNLGVSVYEQQFKNYADSKNILTHFYLSTQLKGRIYDPAYYFDTENQDRLASLDLLLMTQGWRRYVWSEHQLQKIAELPRPIIREGVQGTARSTKKRKRRQQTDYPMVLAYAPDEKGMGQVVEMDENGHFMVTPDHLKIGEGSYVYLKYFASDESKYDIILQDGAFHLLDSQRIERGTAYPLGARWQDQTIEIPYRSDASSIRLEEVVVTAKSRGVKRDKYLGRLDSLAKLELTTDYVCKYNILNCPIHTTDKSNTKPVEGKIYHELLVWTERGFERGTDKSNGFINPQLPPYHYPVLTDEFLLEHYNIIRTKGYYGQREYYQPMHDVLNDPSPDYRNNLLWAPNVVTNQEGIAELTFFCSDLNTQFVIEIEGIGGVGLLGRHEALFRVLKE